MTSRPPLIEFLRGRLSWREMPEEITLPGNFSTSVVRSSR